MIPSMSQRRAHGDTWGYVGSCTTLLHPPAVPTDMGKTLPGQVVPEVWSWDQQGLHPSGNLLGSSQVVRQNQNQKLRRRGLETCSVRGPLGDLDT